MIKLEPSSQKLIASTFHTGEATMSSLAAIDWYEKNKLDLLSKVSNKPINSHCFQNDSDSNELSYLKANLSTQFKSVGIATSELLTLIFPFCLSVILTFILVVSATEYFGTSLFGYAKAIALEGGILCLAAYKTASLFQSFFRVICLTAAIALSISVLHVGAKKSSFDRQSVLISIDTNIQNAQERRAELLATIDSLPETHTTSRRRMLKEVTEADNTIMVLSGKKESMLMANSIVNVSLNEMTDTFVRIVFLTLNMFFTHLLVTKLRVYLISAKASSNPTGLLDKSFIGLSLNDKENFTKVEIVRS